MFPASQGRTGSAAAERAGRGRDDDLAGGFRIFRRHAPFAGFDIGFDLLGLGRARDHAGNRLLCKQPTESEIEQFLAALGGEFFQLLDLVEIRIRQRAAKN